MHDGHDIRVQLTFILEYTNKFSNLADLDSLSDTIFLARQAYSRLDPHFH